MADWPTLDELKQVLDVTSEDWDGEEESGEGPTRLSAALASAINHVKHAIGAWDEDTDVPTDGQSRAALRMAELMATRPDTKSLDLDPAYLAHLYGGRKKFAIA